MRRIFFNLAKGLFRRINKDREYLLVHRIIFHPKNPRIKVSSFVPSNHPDSKQNRKSILTRYDIHRNGYKRNTNNSISPPRNFPFSCEKEPKKWQNVRACCAEISAVGHDRRRSLPEEGFPPSNRKLQGARGEVRPGDAVRRAEEDRRDLGLVGQPRRRPLLSRVQAWHTRDSGDAGDRAYHEDRRLSPVRRQRDRRWPRHGGGEAYRA